MALGPEVWTVAASLVGAVFGAGSALLTQRQAQRGTERTELRRNALALAQERRAERLTHIVAFLEAVQAAERVAVDRHHHGIDDERWHERANAMIDRMWVLQKTIHLLCSDEANDAARKVAFDVRDVIRDGPDDRRPPLDEKVWAQISPGRLAFLDIARDDLRELGR